MIKGQPVWVVDDFDYKILEGVISAELSNSYQVTTPAGERNIKFENCCTNEWSACDRLIIEAKELVRATERRKVRCQDSCLLDNDITLIG